MSLKDLYYPELRFSEFKDMWEEKRLEEVAKITMGQSPDSTSYNNLHIGLPLIQGNADILNRVSIPRQWTSKPTKICELSDILLTVRAPVGAVGKSQHKACIGRGISAIRNKETSNLEFLFQLLLWYEPYWMKLGQGSTFAAISGKDIKNISFFFPSLPEQTKIAAFLSKVDEKIEKQQSLIEQLEQLKKGYMQRLFSQEIRFAKDDGSLYPDWTKRKLSEVGTFISGVGFPNSEQGGSDGIPFLKVSDMNSPLNKKRITAANNYVNQEQISRLKYKPIMKDSIIFAKVGAAVFLERKRVASNFLIDNNMMSYTPNGYIGFFKYFFDTVRLSKYAQTGALPSYNAGDLKTIKINLPTLPEQTKIACFLSSLDKKIETAQQQLEASQTLKKALLQKMFV